MRIALVTETLFAGVSIDGVTTTVKAVADRMIEAGHEVSFVAPGPGLPCYRKSTVARVSPLAKTGRQVRDALDVFGPEMVVSFDPRRIGRKALAHARAWGVRTAVVQQSAVDDEAWPDRVAAHADDVLVTSRWLRTVLLELGVRADLWLPGVDTAAFSPALRDTWLHGHWSRAKSRETPLVVVGYAGRLAKPHGVRRLTTLGAVPGIRPVVIGDGPQRGWLEQRIVDARFTGPLGTGDLAVALASLDVLIHPGEREGCGHVLREAAASGLPVVAPRAGAAAEIVQHLETGLLYGPGDERDLVAALTAVTADPHRALLGRRGREVAAARGWTTAADELLVRLLHRSEQPAA
ncbi:glycosyltransferase [Nocardioides cheoyonin]|uniref:glycosyltransferase n=1 Tax=Nocardioides cheoyonin TaxID=3156615 RepID=UPI0032B42C5C